MSLQQDHSVQHFVYVAGPASPSEFLSSLAQTADQNNLKLPVSSNITVEPWTKVRTANSSD